MYHSTHITFILQKSTRGIKVLNQIHKKKFGKIITCIMNLHIHTQTHITLRPQPRAMLHLSWHALQEC